MINRATISSCPECIITYKITINTAASAITSIVNSTAIGIIIGGNIVLNKISCYITNFIIINRSARSRRTGRSCIVTYKITMYSITDCTAQNCTTLSPAVGRGNVVTYKISHDIAYCSTIINRTTIGIA